MQVAGGGGCPSSPSKWSTLSLSSKNPDAVLGGGGGGGGGGVSGMAGGSCESPPSTSTAHSTPANPFQRAKEALQERGDHLAEVEKQTEYLSNNAGNFATTAARLLEKAEAKEREKKARRKAFLLRLIGRSPKAKDDPTASSASTPSSRRRKHNHAQPQPQRGPVGRVFHRLLRKKNRRASSSESEG